MQVFASGTAWNQIRGPSPFGSSIDSGLVTSRISSSGTPVLLQYSRHPPKPGGGGSGRYRIAELQNRTRRRGSWQSITTWKRTGMRVPSPHTSSSRRSLGERRQGRDLVRPTKAPLRRVRRARGARWDAQERPKGPPRRAVGTTRTEFPRSTGGFSEDPPGSSLLPEPMLDGQVHAPAAGRARALVDARTMRDPGEEDRFECVNRLRRKTYDAVLRRPSRPGSESSAVAKLPLNRIGGRTVPSAARVSVPHSPRSVFRVSPAGGRCGVLRRLRAGHRFADG